MDTNTPSQFISILDQLTTKYRKNFRVRITSIWHAENDFEDLPSRRAIAQSLTAIADSARALISEAAIQLSAVPKTPEVHVIFSGLIWKYIAEIRGDLVSASSVASRLDTSTSFDDVTP